MKTFDIPEIKVIRFTVEDIITSSGRDDEFPITPVGMDEFPLSGI